MRSPSPRRLDSAVNEALCLTLARRQFISLHLLKNLTSLHLVLSQVRNYPDKNRANHVLTLLLRAQLLYRPGPTQFGESLPIHG